MKPHPFSTILPDATGDDYAYLLHSIKRAGKLRYPILLFQGKILDGNQRFRACKEAKVEPKFKEFVGTEDDALEMVWDLNFGRRQLTQSQKATAVAEFTLRFERENCASAVVTQTTKELAKQAGVSERTVYEAKTVLTQGTDEEIKSLKSGKEKAKPLARRIRSRVSKEHSGQLRDDREIPIPNAALPYWNRIPEAQYVLDEIMHAKRQVKKISPDDVMYCEVNLNGVLGDLENAINRFKAAIPAYVCPVCKVANPHCPACKGRGVMSKFMYGMLSDEVKK